MGAGKWIGGALGFIAGGGPLGMLAGMAIGALFDYGLDSVNDPGNSGTFDSADPYGRRQRVDDGQRNSFLFSLLVLASYVIRADGRVMHSEMELVRRFLSGTFGEQARVEGERILMRLFEEQKRQGDWKYQQTVMDCCEEIAANMDYSHRLQLVDFLLQIAKADGSVAQTEVNAVRDCAVWLDLDLCDIEAMFNLGGNKLEEAYKVLGVPPTATDEEVRQAFKRQTLKNHPDKFEALGEDVHKAAMVRFQEINAAKDMIYKERGM